ncbi:MAG: sel1 repeat family protein [Epsilonproteobacteria bacterium]|nr:sel1 repeat family protein [Campylobacterota bacterium]
MLKKLLFITAAVFAFAYPNTKPVDKDLDLALKGKYKKALKHFKQRCKNNDAYACGMSGYFFHKGFGVQKDAKKAMHFYQKGCKLGDKDSCTLLGMMEYKRGKTKQAKQHLRKGCKLGNKDACRYLRKIKK